MEPLRKRLSVNHLGIIVFVLRNSISSNNLDVISRNIKDMSFVNLPFDYNDLRRTYEKKTYQALQRVQL